MEDLVVLALAYPIAWGDVAVGLRMHVTILGKGRGESVLRSKGMSSLGRDGRGEGGWIATCCVFCHAISRVVLLVQSEVLTFTVQSSSLFNVKH